MIKTFSIKDLVFNDNVLVVSRQKENNGYTFYIFDDVDIEKNTNKYIKWIIQQPNTDLFVMEWTRLHHESVTGRDGYSDFYKKDLTIDVLGPVGDVVSEWIIKGAFIKDASFGDMNWDDDTTVMNISLTLGMDYCVLNF